MSLIIIDAPEVQPVSLVEMKAQLGITTNIDDDLIEGLIETATARLDGFAGLLGKCLITQTWKLTLERFPNTSITLPLAPTQSVDAIGYVDKDGLTQTWPADDYVVARLDDHDDPAYILPLSNFPTAKDHPEAVSITFTAGYGDDPGNVPAPIRQAIRMHAAHLYENREATFLGQGGFATVPFGVDELLNGYRTWVF